MESTRARATTYPHAKRYFEEFPLRNAPLHNADADKVNRDTQNIITSQFDTIRLPQKSMERSTRSVLRVATTACTMHDASYIHCVRLAGSKTAMGSLLTAHFHQNVLSECVVAPDGHMSLSMRRLLFHDDRAPCCTC